MYRLFNSTERTIRSISTLWNRSFSHACSATTRTASWSCWCLYEDKDLRSSKRKSTYTNRFSSTTWFATSLMNLNTISSKFFVHNYHMNKLRFTSFISCIINLIKRIASTTLAKKKLWNEFRDGKQTKTYFQYEHLVFVVLVDVNSEVISHFQHAIFLYIVVHEFQRIVSHTFVHKYNKVQI